MPREQGIAAMRTGLIAQRTIHYIHHDGVVGGGADDEPCDGDPGLVTCRRCLEWLARHAGPDRQGPAPPLTRPDVAALRCQINSGIAPTLEQARRMVETLESQQTALTWRDARVADARAEEAE
jgi:hypothetical protein